MSMLSAQIDNLRLMARLVREYDYSEISRMLREAADTIESLRERLQDGVCGREKALEDVLRDIVAGDPKCTARSCGDCEHEEDYGCGIYRRMYELGVLS